MLRLIPILSLAVLLLIGQPPQLVCTAANDKWYDDRGIAPKYFAEKMTRFQSELGMAKESALGDNHVQSKLPCKSGGTDETLTETTLKNLINSVFHIFEETTVNMYYATADYGLKLVSNTDPLRLLWPDYLNIRDNLPSKVWLTFPPCVNTSRYFMEVYGDQKMKPTIEILGMFPVQDLSRAIDELRCLAKLKRLGFKLIPWNIEAFKDNLNEQHCKDLLEEAVSTTSFTEQIGLTQKLLNHVDEISKSPHACDWCQLSKSMEDMLDCTINQD